MSVGSQAVLQESCLRGAPRGPEAVLGFVVQCEPVSSELLFLAVSRGMMLMNDLSTQRTADVGCFVCFSDLHINSMIDIVLIILYIHTIDNIVDKVSARFIRLCFRSWEAQ